MNLRRKNLKRLFTAAATAFILGIALSGCGLTPLPQIGLYPLEPKYGTGTFSHPELAWEPLAPPDDATEEELKLFSKITDITYDVRVWTVLKKADMPDELVYSKSGIRETRHVVKTPLKRGLYVWSVMARFNLSGVESATDWSKVVGPKCIDASSSYYRTVLSSCYYRFVVIKGKN